jgi:ligand-binding sensor protein
MFLPRGALCFAAAGSPCTQPPTCLNRSVTGMVRLLQFRRVMDAYQIRSAAEWDALLGELADETLMPAVLTDATGTILASSGSRYPLCKRIREGEESLTAICSQTNAAMLHVVRRTLLPLVEQCEAGMIRIAIPVVRDGELVCQVAACGRVPLGTDVETFLLSKMLGIDEQEVASLARLSPFIAERFAQGVADRYFSLLASH